jgi:hypothetical protein
MLGADMEGSEGDAGWGGNEEEGRGEETGGVGDAEEAAALRRTMAEPGVEQSEGETASAGGAGESEEAAALRRATAWLGVEQGEKEAALAMMPAQSGHRCEAPAARPAAAPPLRTVYQLGTRVHGRLRERAERWAQLGASKDVLDVVRRGYKIKWYPERQKCARDGCTYWADDDNVGCERHRRGGSRPRPSLPPPASTAPANQEGATVHNAWFEGAVAELVEMGSAVECEAPPTVVSSSNVVPKSTQGKFRLTVNLRGVNKHMRAPRFRMETLQRSRGKFRKGLWAVNFDLTSGYYHCTIREESTEFLGFRVDGADGSTRWYKFTSLPFGLVTAPFEFDRLVKVLVRHWRLADEASLVQYLDDVLAVSDDRDALRSYAQRMLHDFESVGFCINVDKSELEPVDCVTFLGTICCFRTGQFRAPQTRLAKIKAAVVEVAEAASPSCRQLARVAGLAVSMGLARGFRTAMLYTRALYRACAAACREDVTWDSPAEMDEEVRYELKFWFLTAHHDGGLPFAEALWDPDQIVFTDASDTAFGGYIDRARAAACVRMDLPAELRGTSSTHRELWGILQTLIGLTQHGELRRGARVLFNTDSACSAFGVQRAASATHENHELIRAIYECAAQAGIDVRVQWVPREENVPADELSKEGDAHGWGLSAAAQGLTFELFGKCDVDAFATSANARCEAFCSRWAEPRAESVDGMAADWADGRRWLWTPPAPLVERVVARLQQRGGTGILVVPHVRQAAWWSLLFPWGRPSQMVKGVRFFGAASWERQQAGASAQRACGGGAMAAIHIVSVGH